MKLEPEPCPEYFLIVHCKYWQWVSPLSSPARRELAKLCAAVLPSVTSGADLAPGPHHLAARSEGETLQGNFTSHMSFFFSQTVRNAKILLVIPCNLMRCSQNDKTAISPGIDQKNILFLHESSICSNASFKTTVSSLCWLATAPAYLWTTYPGKKTKPKTWGVFCLSSL